MGVHQTQILNEKINIFGGIQKIIDEYNSGKSLKKINLISGIGCKTLSDIIKQNGEIMIRNDSDKSRKYTIDENIFNELTEQSVYWIGFIMGDGCITKTGKEFAVLNVALNEKDLRHVEKFKEFMNTNKPIGYIEKYNTYSLTINSKQICDILSNFDAINRKSYNATEKKNIPNELERHYWRGLIDADGHLRYDSKCDKWYIGLTGSFKLCWQFFDYVAKVIKLDSKTSVRKVSDNGSRVEFVGNLLPLSIIRNLYEDSTIYLERKFATFNKSVEYSIERGVFNNE